MQAAEVEIAGLTVGVDVPTNHEPASQQPVNRRRTVIWQCSCATAAAHSGIIGSLATIGCDLNA